VQRGKGRLWRRGQLSSKQAGSPEQSSVPGLRTAHTWAVCARRPSQHGPQAHHKDHGSAQRHRERGPPAGKELACGEAHSRQHLSLWLKSSRRPRWAAATHEAACEGLRLLPHCWAGCLGLSPAGQLACRPSQLGRTATVDHVLAWAPLDARMPWKRVGCAVDCFNSESAAKRGVCWARCVQRQQI